MGEAEEHEFDWWVVVLKIKVIYFASVREVAATQRESFILPSGAGPADLRREIIKRHPGLLGVLDSARFSVNLEVTEGTVSLHEGDEVGVLPPMAGG